MKKIITIKRSTLGTTVVFRSLLSRKWLFNITLAPKRESLELEFHPNYALAKVAYLCTAIAIVLSLFIGCESPTNVQDKSKEAMTSTKYVQEGYTKNSCWYPSSADAQKDSLKIEGRKYVISERSRYRVETLPEPFIDVLVEGDVTINDWAFYRDTKSDSIYVFNRCDYNADSLGGN